MGRRAHICRTPTVAAILSGMSGFAHASLDAFWRNNPITPAAISNDPLLATMQSWSLMVTYDTGNWSLASVRVTLSPGNVFYQHPLGTNLAVNPNLFPFFPALEFDTYVTDQVANVPQIPEPAAGLALLFTFAQLGSRTTRRRMLHL
jgi:hypothetical protein